MSYLQGFCLVHRISGWRARLWLGSQGQAWVSLQSLVCCTLLELQSIRGCSLHPRCHCYRKLLVHTGPALPELCILYSVCSQRELRVISVTLGGLIWLVYPRSCAFVPYAREAGKESLWHLRFHCGRWAEPFLRLGNCPHVRKGLRCRWTKRMRNVW